MMARNEAVSLVLSHSVEPKKNYQASIANFLAVSIGQPKSSKHKSIKTSRSCKEFDIKRYISEAKIIIVS